MSRGGGAALDMSVQVGSVRLVNPVMTASGTAGHGTELGAYLQLSSLGAVVVKSLSAAPWPGNPPPRLHPTTGGMLNSVGLENPGVESWLSRQLPSLVEKGAQVVASVWGHSVEDYHRAAAMLSAAPAEVVALEVNLSCPNLGGDHAIFSQSSQATAEVIEATEVCGRPRWAKLTPLVADIAAIANAALEAGAEAVTLVNTVPALAIDIEARRPLLGGGAGGLSGRAIHPVALRAVYECRARLGEEAAIVGVGGISRGEHAVAMLLAGASAVQVGTASFADPRACHRVLTELERWCEAHGITAVAELSGGAHERA